MFADSLCLTVFRSVDDYGDENGLRSVFASLRRDKVEFSQPACSDYVADIAGRSSTVLVAVVVNRCNCGVLEM